MDLELASVEYENPFRSVEKGSDAYKAAGFDKLDEFIASIGWNPFPDVSDPENAESSSPIEPERDVRSKLMEPYCDILDNIKDPEPLDDIYIFHPPGTCFDFQKVFYPWIFSGFSSWLVGHKPLSIFARVDTEKEYKPTEKGDAILAFICKEAIIVAVDHSDAGTDPISPSKLVVPDYIAFAPNVFGFVLGDDEDSKIFFRDLPKESERCSVVEFSKRLVESLLSRELKGFSGILIAGWDGNGPSLCCLDGEGKLFEGIMFACGSCSEFGLGLLCSKVFLYMSANEAAKVARIVIPTALALSKYKNGIVVSSDEASESGEVSESGDIGGSVRVHYIQHAECRVAIDIGKDYRRSMDGSKRRRI